MSVLTQKERDGLDEVFLVIHSDENKYKKFKFLASLIFEKKRVLFPNKNPSSATKKSKMEKFHSFLSYFQKTKKNLSK